MKDSKFQDLVFCRLNTVKPLDVVVGDVPDGNEDVNHIPNPTVPLTPVELDWTEAWAKCYISKNENWQHVAKVINKFLVDVQHEMDVDDESVIPSTPPAAVMSTILIDNQPPTTSKTVIKTPAKPNKAKRKRIVIEQEPDEVNYGKWYYDVRLTKKLKFGRTLGRIIKCVLLYMVKHDETFDNALHLYNTNGEYNILIESREQIEQAKNKLIRIAAASEMSLDTLVETVLSCC